MADTIQTESQPTPIRTLAFEYAKAPNYQCLVCHKSILSRSLCIATIERTSKKQKKKLVKPTDTTHFKCWTGKRTHTAKGGPRLLKFLFRSLSA
jgi:hypothetical protein